MIHADVTEQVRYMLMSLREAYMLMSLREAYMLMSLREAYSKFSESHASTNIGLLKFCELRPKDVKLFDHIPHHVCICSYHENIRLLLVVLNKYTTPSVDFQSFINQITCDSSKKECVSCQCIDCEELIDNMHQAIQLALRYQQWQNNDKTEKVDIIDTISYVFAELKRQLRDFFICRVTNRFLRECYYC